jgi:hypothetical protein
MTSRYKYLRVQIFQTTVSLIFRNSTLLSSTGHKRVFYWLLCKNQNSFYTISSFINKREPDYPIRVSSFLHFLSLFLALGSWFLPLTSCLLPLTIN